MRRQAHAAGYSWRKWGDPIIVYHRPWLRDLLFWVICIDLGALIARLTR